MIKNDKETKSKYDPKQKNFKQSGGSSIDSVVYI